jgi:hypothetical protein
MGNYFGTNRFAQLPVKLSNDGKLDTTVFLTVGDEASRNATRVENVTLRLVLSDPSARDLPPEARIAPEPFVAWDAYPKEFLIPPAKGIVNDIEITLNGVALGRPRVEFGTFRFGYDDLKNAFLVFDVNPDWVAFGRNVVGVRVIKRDPGVKEQISVEKVELQIKYKTP